MLPGLYQPHSQSFILTVVQEGALHVLPTLWFSLKHTVDSMSPPTDKD